MVVWSQVKVCRCWFSSRPLGCKPTLSVTQKRALQLRCAICGAIWVLCVNFFPFTCGASRFPLFFPFVPYQFPPIFPIISITYLRSRCPWYRCGTHDWSSDILPAGPSYTVSCRPRSVLYL